MLGSKTPTRIPRIIAAGLNQEASLLQDHSAFEEGMQRRQCSGAKTGNNVDDIPVLLQQSEETKSGSKQGAEISEACRQNLRLVTGSDLI